MTVNTAAKHAANTTNGPTKRNTVVELDASYGTLLDELADVKLTLAEAEARKTEIVDTIKAAAGMNADKAETLVVRVAGIIRAKISLRGRETINAAILKESFPEAFEAARGESLYQAVNPA